MSYNLSSPSGIAEACDLQALESWLERELPQVQGVHVQDVLRGVGRSIDEFVKWPAEALLLWQGCDRTKSKGQSQRYHSYPSQLRTLAKQEGIVLDGRPNGPAIAAFKFAGGVRPARFGSSNAWSVHHLYSGKFPYPGGNGTTHACKDPRHFTQSAGLVAVHPIADALVDEFPFFAWFLRAKSFLRFGYDPDGVFASERDQFGFANGKDCKVILSAT